MSTNTTQAVRLAAELRYADELQRLAEADKDMRPPGWKLSPRAVRRFILGDEPLFEEMRGRFEREIVKGTAREFVAAKLAERDQRVQRAGASRYVVEPNVKEGKGGLRDLHTLFWIGKYV